MAIYGNMVGSSGGILGKTVEIVSDDGTDLMGVVVDQETILTATPNDIRKGKIAATEYGIIEGEKDIPAYQTSEGKRLITSGSSFSIPLIKSNKYDYTALQCIICPYNTSISDSVGAEKVVLDNMVYPVQSTTPEAIVTKDDANKSIVLGITNNTDNIYVLRYFTYKED